MNLLPAFAFLLLAAAAAGAQDQVSPSGEEDATSLAERDAARSEAVRIVASAELELAQLRQENSDYEARIDQYRGAIPWPWVAGALVVALGAGFVGGWWWLDASIRRRYGGFKMY